MFQWDWQDYDDWRQKYGPETNVELYVTYSAVMGFFNGIGVLLKHDLIDVKMAFDLVGNLAIRLWERMEPIIIGQRTLQGFEMWKDFEYLNIRLKKHQELQEAIK